MNILIPFDTRISNSINKKKKKKERIEYFFITFRNVKK